MFQRMIWRQIKKMVGLDRETSLATFKKEVEEGKKMMDVWQRLEKVGKDIEELSEKEEARRAEHEH